MFTNLEFIKSIGDVWLWRVKSNGYYRLTVEPRSGGYVSTFKTIEEAEEAFKHQCECLGYEVEDDVPERATKHIARTPWFATRVGWWIVNTPDGHEYATDRYDTDDYKTALEDAIATFGEGVTVKEG